VDQISGRKKEVKEFNNVPLLPSSLKFQQKLSCELGNGFAKALKSFLKITPTLHTKIILNVGDYGFLALPDRYYRWQLFS
jgi:hypothetical protein